MSRAAPPLFRSAGVRLAVAYAAVFGLSALVLVFVLWSATRSLLNGQVDTLIQVDAQALAERWRQAGAPGVIASIDERLVGNVDDDAVYAVIDPYGRIVAGNVRNTDLQPGLPTRGDISELVLPRHGTRSVARLHRVTLPGDYSLVVGRDVDARAALRDLLAHTLAWAMLLVAGLSILGALVVRRLFQRMLHDVSDTAAAVSAGDLSPRVRLSGRGDEMDRLATTINAMLDRITRLMDGVRQVSNVIAHDLRTPITRARARLEHAAASPASDAELRIAIGRAVDDLDGITAVFQALLRISEIEAGARRSAFEPLDCAPMLRDLAELYVAVAEEQGIRLVTVVTSTLPLRGDRTLLQQAVSNLLDNAIKFSPPGGTVRLAGQAAPGNVVRIVVADEGPGLTPEELARATERFYRGEAARHTPGFGLGLTLVRAVAGLHGGSLTLLPHKPNGLHATLALPAARLPHRTADEPPALAPIGQHEHVAIGR